MHGAAITLAALYLELGFVPDVILASDMLDLPAFLGMLRRETSGIPVAIYFHENQLTYPWSSCDTDMSNQRDNHYAFVNYSSALAADKVIFNSNYHMQSFIDALPSFLRKFPDNQNLETVETIRCKSSVVHLGLDLTSMDDGEVKEREKQERAVILWNHRWEYDKNPQEFFEALFEIKRRGWDFKLVVLGESFSNSPKIFDEAKQRLGDHILHWGFVSSRSEYAYWVGQCDILPVTSNQDFFGGSVVEAMYMNVKPLLPKRLAYPEHIPNSLHHTFFYEEGEFVNKLQRWIKDVSLIRKQQVRNYIYRYDWSRIASLMDGELTDLFLEISNKP